MKKLLRIGGGNCFGLRKLMKRVVLSIKPVRSRSFPKLRKMKISKI